MSCFPLRSFNQKRRTNENSKHHQTGRAAATAAACTPAAHHAAENPWVAAPSAAAAPETPDPMEWLAPASLARRHRRHAAALFPKRAAAAVAGSHRSCAGCGTDQRPAVRPTGHPGLRPGSQPAAAPGSAVYRPLPPRTE